MEKFECISHYLNSWNFCIFQHSIVIVVFVMGRGIKIVILFIACTAAAIGIVFCNEHRNTENAL